MVKEEEGVGGVILLLQLVLSVVESVTKMPNKKQNVHGACHELPTVSFPGLLTFFLWL